MTDIDIFFVGCNENEAMSIIYNHYETIHKPRHHLPSRSKNCISFKSKESLEYQYILRLYQTPSEVIHSFDIDSCCMLYDGDSIYMTKRCVFALFQGFNTVNLELLSPSYEYRLAKYATRGMPVYVPNLELDNVLDNALEDYYYSRFMDLNFYQHVYLQVHFGKQRWGIPDISWKISLASVELVLQYVEGQYIEEPLKMLAFHMKTAGVENISSSKNLQMRTDLRGLDLLLYLETKIEKKYCKRALNEVEDVGKFHSDYSVETSRLAKNELSKILRYITNNKSKFLEIFDGANIPNPDDYKEIYTNNYPFNKHIICIRTSNINKFDAIMNLDNNLMQLFNTYGICEIGQTPVFKVVNPGEQTTSTFNRIVLENNEQWYDGKFYNSSGMSMDEDDSYEFVQLVFSRMHIAYKIKRTTDFATFEEKVLQFVMASRFNNYGMKLVLMDRNNTLITTMEQKNNTDVIYVRRINISTNQILSLQI
eukprot:TRINITY_DN4851_c1_g2_i1.p1 TRINITY_DN4851_c1_g2~~TRINITY_DN4851_c1_g2_i1.p1  ORF type:complete len:480 (-),score=62.86 TRINITY_DN4851_c1_g2_i1:1478-2917(-)